MIRVLLVDDEHLVRAGLRTILEAAGDIAVVGEARDGEEAVTAVRRLAPDVVLMDVRMPVLDGIEATRRIGASGSTARILMLTTFDLDEYVHHALRAGAVGFLLKDTPPRDLAAAVHTIAAGNAMLAPTVTRRLLSAFTEQNDDRAHRARARLATLTEREHDVIRGVARGLSNAEIGRELDLREPTVKAHVSRSLAKLGLTNRVQAAILVHEADLP